MNKINSFNNVKRKVGDKYHYYNNGLLITDIPKCSTNKIQK